MKIVCAWCGIERGEKEPLSIDDKTHTICQECYSVFKSHLEERTLDEEFSFLKKKTGHIYKWTEKALYEINFSEKNTSIEHALSLLDCLSKRLDEASMRIKKEKGGTV